MRPKNSCSSGRSWPIAERLEPLPLGHGALGREHVHRGRPGVDLLRAALEVLLAAVAHVPVAADRHHAELRVERQVGGPADAEHDPAQLGRRRLGPAALEQRPPHPEPGVRRRDPQLGQLVHLARSGRRACSRPSASLVLADHERAVRLGDDELEQPALALPAGVEVVLGAPVLGRQQAALLARGVQGGLAQLEGGAQVAGAPLAEREDAHADRRFFLTARRATAGCPSWPSSAEARPNTRPTVQSTASRTWRARPGIIARW